MFAISVVGLARSDEPAPHRHAHAGPEAHRSDSRQAQILEAWGRAIARETEADHFGFDRAARDALARGLSGGFRKQPPPHALDAIHSDVTRFVDAKKAAIRLALREKNLAAFPAYFVALKKRKGIASLPSGLCYEIVHPGKGAPPRADQTVAVKFKSTLSDGTAFDGTSELGAVEVDLRKAIRGWSEGLQAIGVGGKITLHIPPPLAFGEDEADRMGLPPAAIVISEIELLAVKDSPPEEPIPPPAPVPTPPEPAGFSELQIVETWGWLLAQERGLARADLNETEFASVRAGFALALKGDRASFDEKELQTELAEFVAHRLRAHQRAVTEKRLAQNAAFFDALKTNPAVVRLPSGLAYEILKPGDGPPPRRDQRVKVNYVGRLIDGTVFDRTDPEMGPLDVDIGTVIPGWTEGMRKINRGGKIRLFIPPALAYGEIATGGIPAHSTLIFEVELLEVMDVPAEETKPASAVGG